MTKGGFELSQRGPVDVGITGRRPDDNRLHVRSGHGSEISQKLNRRDTLGERTDNDQRIVKFRRSGSTPFGDLDRGAQHRVFVVVAGGRTRRQMLTHGSYEIQEVKRPLSRGSSERAAL